MSYLFICFTEEETNKQTNKSRNKIFQPWEIAEDQQLVYSTCKLTGLFWKLDLFLCRVFGGSCENDFEILGNNPSTPPLTQDFTKKISWC